MISAAIAHIKQHNVPNENFEFQMLYGIRAKLQQQLHDDGYKVRIYVPYGTQWYPYSCGGWPNGPPISSSCQQSVSPVGVFVKLIMKQQDSSYPVKWIENQHAKR